MRQLSRLPSLLACICLSMILVLGSLSVSSILQNLEASRARIVSLFQASVGQALQGLVQNLQEIETHPLYLSAINDRGKRSHRALASFFLRHGELDQLGLHSVNDCQTISKASLDETLIQNCESHLPRKDGFFWEQAGSGAAVLGLKVVNKSSPTFLIGKIALDREWLVQNPELLELADSYHLRFTQNRNDLDLYELISEGPTGEGKSVASVMTSHWLMRRAGPQLSNLIRASKQISWVFSLLSIVFISLSFLGYWMREKNNRHQLEHFFAWCRDIFSSSNSQMISSLNDSFDDHFLRQCEQIKTLRNQEFDGFNEFIKKQKCLEQRNQRLESDIKKYQQQLSLNAENESLVEHVSKTSPFILERRQTDLKTLKRTSESLRHFRINCENLHSLGLIWQNGLAVKGSRKFLRALCETPSETGYSHLLEEHMNTLIQSSSVLIPEINELSQQISSLQRNKDQLGKTISFWSSLAFVDQEQEHTTQTLEEIIKLCMVLQTNTQRQQWHVNASPDLQVKKFTWVPNCVLATVICDIFSVLGQGKSDIKGDIFLREKTQGEQSYLIFATSISDLSDGSKFFQPKHKDWVRMQNLLLPYEIKLNFSPSGSGHVSISMSWPLRLNILEVRNSSQADQQGNNEQSQRV